MAETTTEVDGGASDPHTCGETTCEVGGVNVRVIVTDDGHAEVHRDDTERYLRAVSDGGDGNYGCEILIDAEYTITDGENDKKILFHSDDDVSNLMQWESGEGPFDTGAFVSHFETVERERPVERDCVSTIEYNGYRIELVASVEDNTVGVKQTYAIRDDFVDYVGDIVGRWHNVVSTDGGGAYGHDAVIVSASGHGSMRTGEWFDDLVSDDGIDVTFVAALDNESVAAYSNIREGWDGRGAIFVKDCR